MKHKLFFICLILMISNYSIAQFTVNTELRPRFELRHGYKKLTAENKNAAYFVSQRTRLNLQYLNEKYKLALSFQDVRVWGDEELCSSTGITSNNASIDLYQAWLWLKLGNWGFIKVGRQEWAYDNQRLLSKRNWNQNGKTYDGVLFGIEKEKLQFDLGLSLNNNDENILGNEYTPDQIKFLDFIYLKKGLNKNSYLSFTGILTGYQKEEGSETIYVTATMGPYMRYANEKYSVVSEFYYQTGTNQQGEHSNAYMFHIACTCKMNKLFSTEIGLDWLSGESKASGDNSFDILYGARRRFYGEMDYFSNLAKSTQDRGLRNFYAKLNYNVNNFHGFNLNYHYYSLQNKPDTPEGQSAKKSLGSEISLIYQYNANIPVNLRVGFSVFFPTQTMEYIQSVDKSSFSYYSYIQLTFTPKLFSN